MKIRVPDVLDYLQLFLDEMYEHANKSRSMYFVWFSLASRVT